MWRADSLEKTLMLGKIKGKRRRGQQRMRWLNSTTNSMDMSLSNLQEIVEPGLLQLTGLQRVRHNLVTEQQQHIQSSHLLNPFIYWHLGCLHILTIITINNAAVNMREHVSCWISVSVFFGYTFRSEIAGSYDSPTFSLWGTSMLLLLPLSHFSRVRLCVTPSLGFSTVLHSSHTSIHSH